MLHFLSLSRRTALFLAAAFVTVMLASSPHIALAAAADPPFKEIWKAGDVTVTAIQDMPGAMSVETFSGPATDAERRKYFTDGKAEAGYNVFLMRIGGQTVLFDSGNGTTKSTPGKLREILAGLGVKPADVDLVLLTHLHMDHVGGVMQGNDRAFPKAKLMVAKPEIDYWLDLAGKKPDNRNAALVKTIAAAYGSDLLPPFAFGAALLPGVTALDAVGHTPGHTVFQIEAGGKKLLVIGDLIHGTPLQFALPDECASYDIDVPAAVTSRKRILALAADGQMHIAGMHLPFSGDGTVQKDGQAFRLDAGK